MGKELPIVPSAPQAQPEEQKDTLTYSRVWCIRENSPPLRLLLDYLKSRGQLPLHPKMDQAALDDWAWVQVSLGYHRERKPIQLFCIRDRGTHADLLEKERQYFLHRLSMFDDEEAGLANHFVTKARFIVTSGYIQADMTDEGYDFNGWLLQFFQENCDGIVQIDGEGFFSPKGDLVVELAEA